MTASSPLRSVAALAACLKAGDRPAYLFFWGHRRARNGALSSSCFSQWYEAPFTVDGVAYPTAEHYMMAGKARLFNDPAALRQILAAPTPAAVKAIGRTIRGFDEARWTHYRSDIVVNANLAKFGQNAALGDFLLATGEQVLVEASPVDPVWGIGLAAADPAAANPAQWKGLNLLGFALMQVRAQLRAEREAS